MLFKCLLQTRDQQHSGNGKTHGDTTGRRSISSLPRKRSSWSSTRPCCTLAPTRTTGCPMPYGPPGCPTPSAEGKLTIQAQQATGPFEHPASLTVMTS